MERRGRGGEEGKGWRGGEGIERRGKRSWEQSLVFHKYMFGGLK